MPCIGGLLALTSRWGASVVEWIGAGCRTPLWSHTDTLVRNLSAPAALEFLVHERALHRSAWVVIVDLGVFLLLGGGIHGQGRGSFHGITQRSEPGTRGSCWSGTPSCLCLAYSSSQQARPLAVGRNRTECRIAAPGGPSLLERSSRCTRRVLRDASLHAEFTRGKHLRSRVQNYILLVACQLAVATCKTTLDALVIAAALQKGG